MLAGGIFSFGTGLACRLVPVLFNKGEINNGY